MADYSAPGVYVEEFEQGSNPMEGVSTSVAGFIGMAEKGPTEGTPVRITSINEYDRVFGGHLASAQYGPNCYLHYAVESFFANGGSSCYVLRVAADGADRSKPLTTEMLTDSKHSLPDARIGLDAFREIHDVSIMAIPGKQSDAVNALLIAHCEELADRFAILDAGCDENVSQVSRYGDSIDSSWCALYHPWIQMFSPLEKKSVFIPPSGAMAGIYARTDSTRGVWKAPANETVRGCNGLSINFTEPEQAKLNPKGINLIRALPNMGIRVWGARTLSSNVSWKYVNVRRLFICVEQSIRRGIGWAAFEPNDASLWSRVNGMVQVFLTGLWRNGALAGSSPEEAFFVSAGKGSSMTDDDVKSGRLIVVIGIAAVKPADFTIVRVTQQVQEPE